METIFREGKIWFDVLPQVLGLAGLFLGVHTLRQDTRSRKLGNALALTTNHRELWTMMIEHPALERVLDDNVNLKKNPPTLQEELFVQMLILHLRTAISARKLQLEIGDENIEADIRDLFKLKIPRAIWERTKVYHAGYFARIIDDAITSEQR